MGVPFPVQHFKLPALTRAQMAEVDRLAISEFNISLLQMMENAGRSLAHLGRVLYLKNECRGKKVTVIAGTGGNGGGVLAAARRLHIWGAQVAIVLTRELDAYEGATRHQLSAIQEMGVVIFQKPPVHADLVLDGLVGYSLDGAPTGPVAQLIRWINQQISPVLAMDMPSGLDPDTGVPHDPCVRASATLTLALPKVGLLKPPAKPYIGELYLADISIPGALYISPSLDMEVGPIFHQGDILRLAY